MQIDELIDNFELLDDWEDKYRYLIDLGGKLPPLDEKLKTDEWKVVGCQSQVWLVPDLSDRQNITFKGDSDAAIVKGLIFVVLSIFNHCSVQKIKETDVTYIFARMGLEEHLSPSRRNGLNAMVEKIKFYAQN
uniref:Cysteine desulfuration protein SufE n=1 Tax=uncultured Alphaproteobacteria bacterium TaxID=91750 RepID=A0A6G8F2K2_9PROT|nr:cysteine desulfuration protein SufE [uncultured Alphaproteobacteria bacterium]